MRKLIISILLSLLFISASSQIRLGTIASSRRAATSTLLNGLIAYWKLDEASGTLYDETTNNYDGTPTDITFQQTTITNGIYSVSYNGTSSKIVVGSGGTGYPKPTTGGTIAIWFKSSDTGDKRFLYARPSTNYGMIIYHSGGAFSWLTGNGTTETENNLTGTYSDGSWHLLILCWDGTNKYG